MSPIVYPAWSGQIVRICWLSRILRRTNSQGWEACRTSSGPAHKVRVRHQPQAAKTLASKLLSQSSRANETIE